MTVIRTALVIACLGFVPCVVAQDWDEYEFTTSSLDDGIYVLSGAGTHHLVCAAPSGLLVVDANYAEMGEKLAAALDALDSGPVRKLVNTHWHYDHVGGNARLARAGAAVVAHDNVRRYMTTNQHIDIINVDVPAAPKGALPTETFTDSLRLEWGGRTVRVVHFPHAHTDGDAIVHLPQANVVQTGDLLFNGSYPFIDVNHGGTIDGLIAAVEATIALCDDETVVVPGHGPIGDRQDLVDYLAMLRTFRTAIAEAKAAGRGLESLRAESPTPDLDAEYGQRGFTQAVFAEIVYRTLPE